MPGAPIEFYFDFSSPYGYLASERIENVAAEFGRTVLWRPIPAGRGVQIDRPDAAGQPDPARSLSERDMDRSARKHGIKFALPEWFPFSSVYPCRIFYWLKQADGEAAKPMRTPSTRSVRGRQIASCRRRKMRSRWRSELGHDRAAVQAGMQDQAMKDQPA